MASVSFSLDGSLSADRVGEAGAETDQALHENVHLLARVYEVGEWVTMSGKCVLGSANSASESFERAVTNPAYDGNIDALVTRRIADVIDSSSLRSHHFMINVPDARLTT